MNTCRTQTRILGRSMRAFVRQNERLSPEPLPEQGWAAEPGQSVP